MCTLFMRSLALSWWLAVVLGMALWNGISGAESRVALVVEIPSDGLNPALVSLPAGCFLMGSPENEPGHCGREFVPPYRTCVKAFAIGKYEVTFAEYDAFATATGRDKPVDHAGWGRGRRPVIYVSWDDAVAYAQWLSQQTGKNYRLPTEVEWEYSARAGTRTPFWTGNCITTDEANYNGNYDYNGCGAKTDVYREQTIEVGSLAANPWGLYDTSGNVWEWTCSASGGRLIGEEHTCAKKVNVRSFSVRGGSFIGGPTELRAACSDHFVPDWRTYNLGFRLVRY